MSSEPDRVAHASRGTGKRFGLILTGKRFGLILDGGGAPGACEVSALPVSLLAVEATGEHVSVVAGTSVGALDGAWLASDFHRQVGNLADACMRLWRMSRWEDMLLPAWSPRSADLLARYFTGGLVPGVRVKPRLDGSPLAISARDGRDVAPRTFTFGLEGIRAGRLDPRVRLQGDRHHRMFVSVSAATETKGMPSQSALTELHLDGKLPVDISSVFDRTKRFAWSVSQLLERLRRFRGAARCIS